MSDIIIGLSLVFSIVTSSGRFSHCPK